MIVSAKACTSPYPRSSASSTTMLGGTLGAAARDCAAAGPTAIAHSAVSQIHRLNIKVHPVFLEGRDWRRICFELNSESR